MDDSNNINTAEYKMLIKNMSSDMKFLSILSIIYGAVQCLGIVTAIIGIPIIIAGLRLKESAEKFSSYAESENPLAMANAIEKMSSFFNIYKILAIIAIILSALIIFGVILMFSFIGLSLME